MSTADADINLEIVASTYRFVSDDDAWGEVLQSWAKKLQKAEARSDRLPVDNDQVIKGHLEQIRSLLDSRSALPVRTSLEEAVSQIDAAALVMSPRGIVAAMNEEAGQRFGAVQGAVLERDWLDPISVQDFDALCASARDGQVGSRAIVRTYSDDAGRGLAEVFLLSVHSDQESYLVIRALETEWSSEVDLTLESAFGFSKAEREVARALYETRDTAEIAFAREKSPATIRTQIKSMLSKTETSSQVDLIRLLGLLNARASHARRAPNAGWMDPWSNQTFFQMKEGGRLAYTWCGAEDGKPALVVHGLNLGYILGRTIEDKLKDAGIRLYALSRPGVGGSDRMKASHLESHPRAIEWLLDHLDLGSIPAIGLGNGSAVLFKAAAQNPDRFSRLLVTGVLQNYSDNKLRSLTPFQRTAAKIVQFAPTLSETLTKATGRFVEEKGVEWFIKRVWSDVPEVQDTINNPEILPLIRNACGLSLSATTWDFNRERQIPWEIDPAVYTKIGCPVHHMRGDYDRSVDATDVEKWLKVSSNFTSETVEGAGYFLPYEKPDLFADRLIKTVLG